MLSAHHRELIRFYPFIDLLDKLKSVSLMSECSHCYYSMYGESDNQKSPQVKLTLKGQIQIAA